MRGPTTLSVEVLNEIAQQGLAEDRASKFVDPHAVYRLNRLLDEYGELWAASVLRRDLSRRSRMAPSRPWLYPGELETLLIAERREFDQIVDAS